MYSRLSPMASLTNSKHFTTSHHPFHKTGLKGLHNLISTYLSHQLPPSFFFHWTLLPRHSLFENAKLSSIHLLLKIYLPLNDLQKNDLPSFLFCLSLTWPRMWELLNYCLWAVYFSGGYIICLSGSVSASSQSSFYLTFCIHPFLCIWILSKLLLKPSLTYALRIRLISKSSHTVFRF